MLAEIANNHNGAPYPADPYQPYPPCPSDYEERPSYAAPLPGWRHAHPKYVHHVEWVDADNRKHGLTLRTDDREEMLETLRCVKAALAAPVASGAEAETPACNEPEPPQEHQEAAKPKTKPCPVCAGQLLYLKTGQDGGQWYSHKLADGGWCKGK